VAGDTLAIFRRLMFDLGFGKLLLNVVMAFGAQFAARLDQQLFVVRLVGIVARDTLAIFRRLMFDLGFGELLLNVVMALGAQLPVGFDEQLLICRLVGIVAGSAFAVFDGLMFDFGGVELFVDVVVAFGAQLAVGLDQQALEIRTVRVVAGEAFAVFDGLMFGLRGFWKWVVALGTQGWGKLDQQVCVGGLVGIVAGSAFAIFDGLMFDLGLSQGVFVTREADRPPFARHSLGRLGLVAFGALAVGVGRVDVEFRPVSLGGWLGDRVGLRRASSDLSRGGVGGCAWHRDAVKEESQPLLFSRAGATSQQHQAQEQAGQTAADRNWPRRGRTGVGRFVYAHQAAFRARDYFLEPNP
jgi:hypothetical protein